MFQNFVAYLAIFLSLILIVFTYALFQKFLACQEEIFYKKEKIEFQKNKIINLYAPFLKEYIEHKSQNLAGKEKDLSSIFEIYLNVLEILVENIHLVPKSVFLVIPEFNAYLTLSDTSVESFDLHSTEHFIAIENLYSKIAFIMIEEYKAICKDLKIDCNCNID